MKGFKNLVNAVYIPGSTPLTSDIKKPKGFRLPQLADIFRYPVSAVEIYPTRNCPENCDGCSVPVSVRWGREERKDPDWWVKTIKELDRRGLTYCMILGGEPVGYPGIERIIKTLSETKKMNGGLFTDGIILKKFPQRMDLLMENGLRDLTVHSSVDFLVAKEPPLEMRRDIGGSRFHKAFYGLELLSLLKNKGVKRVIANAVVMKGNLDQILPIYYELEKREICLSLTPYQWQVHLYQGRPESEYTSRLTYEDSVKIKEIMEIIIANEKRRIKKRKTRIIANSSRYLRAISDLGITQTLGCNNSYQVPGVFTIMPDGSFRHCPTVATMEQVKGCPGCHYGYRDRDPRYEEFLAKMKIYDDPNGEEFGNIIHKSKKEL